jgi:hypothetical protein
MRRVLVGVTCLAALTAAAAAPAGALALPQILPQSTTERKVTGHNEGELRIAINGGQEMICESATGEGAIEAGQSSGPFHTKYTGCSAEGGTIKCTGLAEASGVILALGKVDLVYDNLSPLSVASLLLPERVHISCSALVLVEMKGDELCLALKPTESNTTHTDHCVQSSGVASDKKFFNSEGSEVSVKLECAINEGTAKECAELGLAVGTTTEALFADI